MIELIKKEIHMNRQRGTAVSQLTLDDDFIVPDALINRWNKKMLNTEYP